jgi:hypothetical protein
MDKTRFFKLLGIMLAGIMVLACTPKKSAEQLAMEERLAALEAQLEALSAEEEAPDNAEEAAAQERRRREQMQAELEKVQAEPEAPPPLIVDATKFTVEGTKLTKYIGTETHVTIPEGVTTVGTMAFSDNKSITNVTIPPSVTAVERNVFQNCTNLSVINVDSGNNNYSSLDGVLFNKNGQTMIYFPLGKTSFMLPASMTVVPENGFSGRSKLTNVTLPASLREIGNYAFLNCVELTSITIPATVTGIGSEAFNGCSKLALVTILNGTPPGIGRNVFPANTLEIKVPASAVDAYKAASIFWDPYKNRISAIE